jgi:hypothetical protein
MQYVSYAARSTYAVCMPYAARMRHGCGTDAAVAGTAVAPQHVTSVPINGCGTDAARMRQLLSRRNM